MKLIWLCQQKLLISTQSYISYLDEKFCLNGSRTLNNDFENNIKNQNNLLDELPSWSEVEHMEKRDSYEKKYDDGKEHLFNLWKKIGEF